MAQSIAQMIREQSEARPDGIAITYEGRDITASRTAWRGGCGPKG